ncbi:MAG: transposase [Myxococcales bacterium]|nr:transposase [Myxococcales bacterium]
MKRKRQKHTAAFKAKVALEAIREQTTIAEIARVYKLNPNLVHKWKAEAIERMAVVFEQGRASDDEALGAERETELLRKVGQLTLENDFLARGLARIR